MPGTATPLRTGSVGWRPGDQPPPDLDARLQLLQDVLAEAGYPVRVVSKTRTKAQQQQLYAQGRTRPGAIITEKSGEPGQESRHQLGHAADFAFTSRKENWPLLGETAKQLGLEWGGDWSSLVDKPHVQLPRKATFTPGSSARGVTDPASAKVFDAAGVQLAGPPPAPAIASAAAPPAPEPPLVGASRRGRDIALPSPGGPRMVNASLSTPGPTSTPLPPPAPPPTVTKPVTPPAPAVPAAARPPNGGAPPTRQDIEDLIRLLAKEYKVDPDLALSIAEVESNFNPTARSAKGARGVMQLMPGTAKTFGVENPDDLDDPGINIRAALQYMRNLEVEHQGNQAMVARRYVGSPRLPKEKSDFYVRRVFDKYRQRVGLPPDTTNVDTEGRVPAPPGKDDPEVDAQRGIPVPSFMAQQLEGHPWLDALAEAADPHEAQGRQNLAGGIGSVAGGYAGGALGALAGGTAGTFAEPGGGTLAGAGAGVIWGRRAGSALGAGLLGGAEQALVEETGVGDWVSRHLPWGTQDTPTPPPDPTSTLAGRVAGAAGTQAAQDVAGQVIMAPLRILGKRAVQTPIAKAAHEKLLDARNAAAAAFDATKLGLTRTLRTARQAKTDAMAGLSDLTTTQLAKFKEGLQTTIVRPAQALRQAARDAKVAGREAVIATHDPLIQAARQRAKDAVTKAETTGAAALAEKGTRYQTNLAAAAPSAPKAGRAVADVFNDAAQAPKRIIGEAIDKAADEAPARNIVALQTEAARIQAQENLPRIFPHGRVAAIVDAIVNATDAAGNPTSTLPFKQLHVWKKELQELLRGTYDKDARSAMEGATLKLTKLLRKTLAGDEAYDAATKAYEDIAPRYTNQLARTIRKTARTSPEEIANLIDVEKPTQAGFLYKLMTEAASEGGDAAGGRKALEAVQDHWFFKKVLEGDLKTLGDRLAVLKRRPDFVKAFLGDARMSTLVSRAEQLAAEYPALEAQHAGLRAAAETAGKADVKAATTAGKAALKQHRDVSTQAIRAATAKVTTAIDQAKAVYAQGKGITRAAKVQLRDAHNALIETAKKALEDAKSPELEAAITRLVQLDRSTLGGANLRAPSQVVADAIGAMRPTNLFSGLSRARFLLGASDADIARYVVYASKPVRALTRATVTPTLKRGAPAVVSQAIVKPVVEANRTSSPPPRR